MTKRKYRIFIRYVLLFIIIMPLICLMLRYNNDNFDLFNDDAYSVISRFELSYTITQKINTVISQYLFLDGSLAFAVSTIMGNAIVVYIAYLMTEVMLFIPKMGIWFFDAFGKGGKEY